MNVTFRIVLVIVVMDLVVESWKYLRRTVPAPQKPNQRGAPYSRFQRTWVETNGAKPHRKIYVCRIKAFS
jgi:hypothetical protein